MFFHGRARERKNLKKNQRVLPNEKNTQNKFHKRSFKIGAVAPKIKCRFCISFSRVSRYFMRVLYARVECVLYVKEIQDSKRY